MTSMVVIDEDKLDAIWGFCDENPKYWDKQHRVQKGTVQDMKCIKSEMSALSAVPPRNVY